MNWLDPRSRTQIKIIRQYHRMLKMNEGRLTRRLLLWDRTLSEEGGLKTWFSELKSIAVRNNLTEILMIFHLIFIRLLSR